MPLPELRRAFERWGRVAVRLLKAGQDSNISLLRSNSWALSPSGDVEQPILHISWNLNEWDAMLALPEWHEVVRVASQIPCVHRHFDLLIGTAFGAAKWSLEDEARFMLPEIKRGSGLEAFAIEPWSVFTRRYRDFEAFVESDIVEQTSISPILGITLETASLLLAPGDGIIRRLTPEEYVICLNNRLLQQHRGRTYIPKAEAVAYALVCSQSYPKVFGRGLEYTEVGQNIQISAGQAEDDLLASLAVMGLKDVNIAGRLNLSDWKNGYSISYGRAPLHPLVGTMGEAPLDRAKCRELQAIWRTIRDIGKARNQALHLAVLRFAYVQSRSRIEDQVLDLMIAAEALYLGTENATDRGELKFRLSLRAACWARPCPLHLTRKQVFQVMQKMYDARSAIAHGSLPKSNSIKMDGKPVTLSELLYLASAIVKQGLRRALREAARSKSGLFEPDWETLILPAKSREPL